MERDYQPLPIRELGANAGFRRPLAPQSARVTQESPAAQVMTDLTRVAPATIRPQAPLAGANQFMITRGVRLLLVIDEQHETVVGLITATDILGERPMLVATERGLRRDELTVADIMTPAAQVQVVAFGYAQGARVGHVLGALAGDHDAEFGLELVELTARRAIVEVLLDDLTLLDCQLTVEVVIQHVECFLARIIRNSHRKRSINRR